ncbi:MAG: aminoacyl-tRNA hydrolase [Negativibacillus sp.]
MDMFDLLKQKLYPQTSSGPVEYLIVGLGNPESKYLHTRHNAGFLAIDRIGEKSGIAVDRMKYKALSGVGQIGGKRVLLMKPQTYMNNSGEAVQEAMSFYKIPAEKVLVIFDDVSLDVGKMRIRRKGSDGGHNGIKSIIQLCGSENFPRIKIGVGKKPHPGYDLADWVLSRFTEDERKALSPVFDQSWESVKLFLDGQLDKAMNQFNS